MLLELGVCLCRCSSLSAISNGVVFETDTIFWILNLETDRISNGDRYNFLDFDQAVDVIGAPELLFAPCFRFFEFSALAIWK